MKTLGQRRVRLAFISVLLAVAVGGCELIASVDRETGTGGSGLGTGGSSGSGGSSGGLDGSDDGSTTGTGGDMTGTGGMPGTGGDEGMDGAAGTGGEMTADAAEEVESDAGSPDDATTGDGEIDDGAPAVDVEPPVTDGGATED